MRRTRLLNHEDPQLDEILRFLNETQTRTTCALWLRLSVGVRNRLEDDWVSSVQKRHGSRRGDRDTHVSGRRTREGA